MARRNGGAAASETPELAPPAPNGDTPAEEPVTGSSLRAAAIRVRLDDRAKAKKQSARRQAWQDDSWAMFDDCGPVKFGTWYAGNAISKVRLFAAVTPIDAPDAEPIPATDEQAGVPLQYATRAQAEIDRIKGPLGGKPEILRVTTMNLDVAAECYLVMEPAHIEQEKDPADPTGQTVVDVLVEEAWDVRSILEVNVKADGAYEYKDEPSARMREVPADWWVIRIYQRHPAWGNLADCHMRAALTDCESLVLLNNEVKAESKSRQSNGILKVPNGISFGAPIDTDDDVEDGEAEIDPFEDMLMDAILEPISDPGSAWSVYPLVVRGDKESLDAMTHLSLHRESSDKLEERINGRVEAIARALNLPVEVMTGHQQTTFANAAQVDQDTFDDHLQPRVMLLCDALTVGFLQPALIESGVPEDIAARFVVWYDAADLIQRVDPVDSADFGVQQGVISDEAWRRVKGWSDDDAPEPADRLVRAVLMSRLFDGPTIEAVITAVQNDTEVELPEPAPPPEPPAPGQTPPPAQAPPVPVAARILRLLTEGQPPLRAAATKAVATADNPGRKLADIDREARTRILTAANMTMNRVLERGGNRLKARTQGTHLGGALRKVHPIYAVQHLGPALLASGGFDVQLDLIGDDAFRGLHEQFMAWGSQAQHRALDIAAKVGKFTRGKKDHLAQQQASALVEAWDWLHGELHHLAEQRLYQPDRLIASGEIDPSARVPAGLIRTSLAIAGGDTGITMTGPDPYVAVSNGEPLGGIATGETITTALADENVLVAAWQWDYGPAFRLNPFPDHEDLDGVVFGDLSGDAVTTDRTSAWIGSEFYPGDHDGCLCDLIPVMVLPEDIEE